jgi:hypothetical protein
MKPDARGIAALEILEKFIAARTLAERLPLMETRTPEPELAASCLAAPLPAARGILMDTQEANPSENVLDVYFSVDFEAGEDQTAPQTILVKIRENTPPKVMADPFLDMFGGRLATYAKTPSKENGTFQVVAWAVASCTNPRVHDRENKLTLDLLPREDAIEITQAYFRRDSKIGNMLAAGTQNLTFGKAKPSTVTLRWNIEENPEQPYLEAVDLKTMDWNP